MCRPETKRLHALEHACSGNVEAEWGASGSCHSDSDLSSLLQMQNASPVADNAGEIPALLGHTFLPFLHSLHLCVQHDMSSCPRPLFATTVSWTYDAE